MAIALGRSVVALLGAVVLLACTAAPATPTPAPTATPTAVPSPTATVLPTPVPTTVPIPTSVQLTPGDLVLRPLESKPLTVAVLDQFGVSVTDYAVLWEVTDNGATVDPSAKVTAGTRAGTYTITATAWQGSYQAGVKGTATLTVEPGALTRVEVAPKVARVPAGATLQLQATAYDSFENPIPHPVLRWQARSAAGTVDGRGLFTAATITGMHADAIAVEALEGPTGRTDRATVAVVPGPPARIEIQPGPVALLPGQSQAFSAKVFDRYGNEIRDASVGWSVAGGGGAIDQEGKFTAGAEPGSYPDTIVAEVRGQAVRVSAKVGITVARYLLGPIVFEAATADYAAVFTMGPDGRDRTRLTTNDESGSPAWSPDGLRIAYTSFQEEGAEIYRMDAAGTNQVRLTDNVNFDAYPTWSSDGARIAFASSQRGGLDIFVMNADGTRQVRLTQNRSIDFDSYPYWSPIGDVIVYSSDEGDEIDPEVWVIKADGTGKRKLTNNQAWDIAVGWYPDGSKILFLSDRDGQDLTDLYIMNPDGSDVTRLTFTPSIGEEWASFSPDGTQIVFSNSADRQVWVMDANGKNPRPLTKDLIATAHPQWRPNSEVPVRPFVIGATVSPLTGQSGPGVHFPIEPARLLPEEERYTEYTTAPPTSGPRWSRAAPWGIYASPIANERQVANLAQGGILIQYNTKDRELITKLEEWAKKQEGFPCYVIVAPYPTMPFTIALTGWGVRDTMTEVDEARLKAFLEVYRGNGPEPTACNPDEAGRVGAGAGSQGPSPSYQRVDLWAVEPRRPGLGFRR